MEPKGNKYSFENCYASTENRKSKPHNTRYFIIKSLNHQNLQLSIKKGIWATQVMNEPTLEEAFHVRILLVYVDMLTNILSIVIPLDLLTFAEFW